MCLWIKDALLKLERLYKKYWQEKEAKFKVMIAQQTCFQTWLCPLFSYTNLLSLVWIGKVLWATQQRRSVLVMNRKNEALHVSFFLVLYSHDKTIKMQSDAKFCWKEKLFLRLQNSIILWTDTFYFTVDFTYFISQFSKFFRAPRKLQKEKKFSVAWKMGKQEVFK